MIVGIFGAGAIGGSLGVQISAAGFPVRMLARPSLVAVADALVAYDRKGRPHHPGDDLEVDDDPAVLSDVDLCLVTVKSRDTEDAAKVLAEVLPERAAVVSFQNGLRNPERLRRHLKNPVAGGMVTYNVVRPEPAVFRQATKGPLVVGELPGRHGKCLTQLGEGLRSVGVDFEIDADVEGIQAGKLLLNLNNIVCAVAGVPIATSVRNRTLRWCFAQLMREGLRVMKAAGVAARPVVGLPASVIARVITLPDWVVLRVAKSMVDIDPQAKSSTLQDLEANKPTEVDDLSGEIVRLAERAGTTAPLNALMVEAVHELEQAPPPKPHWSAAVMAERLGALL
jgi:2-dehydropantoate 2-reductase